LQALLPFAAPESAPESALKSLLVGYHESNLDGATHYSRGKGVREQIRTGFLTKHLDKLFWSCGVTT